LSIVFAVDDGGLGLLNRLGDLHQKVIFKSGVVGIELNYNLHRVNILSAFYQKSTAFFNYPRLLNRGDEAGSIDQANKVALIAVAVPSAEGEVLVVVGQHSVGEPLNIIPTVRHAEGEELTVVTRHSGIFDLDLVGGDRSNVHCVNRLHPPSRNLKLFLQLCALMLT
tara:strand:+ start:70 stop:570 length:501 start_codon:yes stop_codon:yes gene_type:complete